MPTFYSQQGNPEVWKTKPDGYFTFEEWQEMQPKPEPPKPLTLGEMLELKIAEINTAYSQVIKYVQAGYPLEEVLSWDVQYIEAMALLNDPEASAIFVRQLARVKGVSVEEMRDRILANAESWQYVAGLLTAQRQLMEEAVLAAGTLEEVEAVKVAFSV